MDKEKPEFVRPFRVGKKQNRAILDANGKEVCIFKTISKLIAQDFCDYLNNKEKIVTAKGQTFSLTENEVKEANNFKELVKKRNGKYGQFSYFFIPTGIGTVVYIYSHLEGIRKEITEYGEW